MAKKVSFRTPTKSGAEVIMYGQLSDDGRDVFTWTKHSPYGIFRIERFGARGLTAKTLEHVMKVGDLP